MAPHYVKENTAVLLGATDIDRLQEGILSKFNGGEWIHFVLAGPEFV
jgi:hypothetical protein